MRLYMLRHGETKWNALRKIQGSADTELNEKGIALAKITGEKLLDVPFDFAVSSPLKRAYKTAELALGGRDIPIYTDDRLKEIDFGAMEGEKVLSVPPEHPFSVFFRDAYHFVPAEGGETIQQVIARTGEFYRELTENPKLQDKTILIATHGCALRGILNHIYEDTTDFWHGGVCPNCGVNIVEVTNGKSVLVEEDKIY